MSEFLRGLLMPWRWRRRRGCHGDIWPCQYTDRPNDNHGRRWFAERYPSGDEDSDWDDSAEIAQDERRLLATALLQWGAEVRSPTDEFALPLTNPTDKLAVALGFRDEDDLRSETRRIMGQLESDGPISRRDVTRALAAAEVVFASDIFGAGTEWEIVTGLSDAETIAGLRNIQRNLDGDFSGIFW